MTEFEGILDETGIGQYTRDYIMRGLAEEDLVVVPRSRVYLTIRLPRFRRRRKPPAPQPGVRTLPLLESDRIDVKAGFETEREWP